MGQRVSPPKMLCTTEAADLFVASRPLPVLYLSLRQSCLLPICADMPRGSLAPSPSPLRLRVEGGGPDNLAV